MCLGCLTAAAQQDTFSPANSSAQTSPSAPSQTESQATQDQNQIQKKAQGKIQEKVQSEDSAKPQPDTRILPQPRPAKKQKQNNAGNPKPNQRSSRRLVAPPPAGTSKKIVVRHGGADEPTAQIVTGMTADEADRQRREAELLLSTTDEKLKEIAPRARDSQQQETVSQIHNYLEGSRSALKQGDVSRAHTLALKAGLLAEDLASH
jgi:hypothetical protein